MATAKVCDRCGAVINPRNSGLYIILGAGGYRTGTGESKDLCCSCALQLKKFFAWQKKSTGAQLVRGHWITEEEAEERSEQSLRDTCSVCGHCDWDCTESASFNFCPNCGADMRETNNEI